MEGKGVRAVVMGLLILGLVFAQIEAKSCCVNTTGRNCYNACRVTGTSQTACANLCGCIHVTGSTCPSTHPKSNMLENSGAMINKYCKLGCASSVCDAITSLNQNSDVREGEVKEAVDHCKNACSELCNNGAKTLFPLPADNMPEKSVEIIEEVTTDVKAALPNVFCREVASLLCFNMCHDTREACAKHCGCTL